MVKIPYGEIPYEGVPHGRIPHKGVPHCEIPHGGIPLVEYFRWNFNEWEIHHGIIHGVNYCMSDSTLLYDFIKNPASRDFGPIAS